MNESIDFGQRMLHNISKWLFSAVPLLRHVVPVTSCSFSSVFAFVKSATVNGHLVSVDLENEEREEGARIEAK